MPYRVDTVSAFCGIGKKTAWEAWRASYIFKSLFSRLSQSPSQISEDDVKSLERFVVLLYKRTSTLQNVNEARKRLFAFGNRQLENIPPINSALLQHVERAVFQAGYVWGQSLVANASVPTPSESFKSCRELVKCACKNICRGRCKCYQSNLPCIQLCACGGQYVHRV